MYLQVNNQSYYNNSLFLVPHIFHCYSFLMFQHIENLVPTHLLFFYSIFFGIKIDNTCYISTIQFSYPRISLSPHSQNSKLCGFLHVMTCISFKEHCIAGYSSFLNYHQGWNLFFSIVTVHKYQNLKLFLCIFDQKPHEFSHIPTDVTAFSRKPFF